MKFLLFAFHLLLLSKMKCAFLVFCLSEKHSKLSSNYTHKKKVTQETFANVPHSTTFF